MEQTASERVLMMPSLLAYAGQLYLVAGTNEGPFRLFASTAAETLPQPGDYVEPAPDPSDPGEPSEPGDPGEPSEPNGNTPLAQTGDGVPLQVAATASLIAVAALALALGALARRGKAAVKR